MFSLKSLVPTKAPPSDAQGELYVVRLPEKCRGNELVGKELKIDGRTRVCRMLGSEGVAEPGSDVWIVVETKAQRKARLKATEFPRAATEQDREARGQTQPPLFE